MYPAVPGPQGLLPWCLAGAGPFLLSPHGRGQTKIVARQLGLVPSLQACRLGHSLTLCLVPQRSGCSQMDVRGTRLE